MKNPGCLHCKHFDPEGSVCQCPKYKSVSAVYGEYITPRNVDLINGDLECGDFERPVTILDRLRGWLS